MGKALTIAPILASLAFAYLGYQEVKSSPSHDHQEHLSYSLALPMTLNNLAGGVAGGAAGIGARVAFLYALVASLVTMAIGHVIGWKLAKSSSARRQAGSSDRVAAIIYFSLSLVTFFEVIR